LSNAGGPAGLAGTTSSSIRPHRRWSYIPNRDTCRLLAQAALLSDLANMVDASLANPFGVVFEAPWMGASEFRSLEGVLGAVSGPRKALSECVYILVRSQR
jgi:hypothetical protein